MCILLLEMDILSYHDYFDNTFIIILLLDRISKEQKEKVGAMLFFSRIRDLREDHDLTQKDICEYLYCDQSLYSKYERGQRAVPIEIIIKLAQYYGTSTDYILGLTDHKKPYE